MLSQQQAAAPLVKTGKARYRRRIWAAIRGWLFIGPVVFGTLLFNILPLLPTFYASLTSWNGLGAPKWVGLANYERALGGGDDVFLKSLQNTIIYTIGYVPLGIVVGLALALLTNQRLPGISFFRGLFFLPVVTSLVAVGMIWRWIFNWHFGPLNWGLTQVGIPAPRWLGDPTWAMVAVIITGVWASMGYNMVILLAGLQNIPQDLLDAASVDGAGTWARFRNVTLPLLTPAIFFLSILSVIGSFQVFALIYVMTGGGPGSATFVYIYHLWQQAFQLRNMGYASALAVMLFAVIAAITAFQWQMSKRWVFYQ
jgi:multiple sugar transport system permease protein